jgi:hypothetical protein
LSNTGFADGAPRDDDRPQPTGKPSWIRNEDGSFDLYFSWSKLFEDIRSSRKVIIMDGEMVALKRRILKAVGEKEFQGRRVRVETGVQRRFIVWQQRHIDALEALAHPSEVIVD